MSWNEKFTLEIFENQQVWCRLPRFCNSYFSKVHFELFQVDQDLGTQMPGPTCQIYATYLKAACKYTRMNLKQRLYDKKSRKVWSVHTADEPMWKPHPWGFRVGGCWWGGDHQEGGKCGESLSCQGAQIRTNGKILWNYCHDLEWSTGISATGILCHVREIHLGLWKAGWPSLSFLSVSNLLLVFYSVLFRPLSLFRDFLAKGVRWQSTSGVTTRSSTTAQKACESPTPRNHSMNFILDLYNMQIASIWKGWGSEKAEQLPSYCRQVLIP